MKSKSEYTKKILLLTAVMLILSAAGRAVSYFNSAASTNIAYAAWIPSVLSYLAEILVCARISLAAGGIAYTSYMKNKALTLGIFTSVFTVSLADYAARFLIDLLTNAIAEAELLALSWLFMQFLYEAVLFGMFYLIGSMMYGKYKRTEVLRIKQKFSMPRSAFYSAMLLLFTKLAFEAVYLAEFLAAYSDITAGEVSSIIGSFLKIIYIYGGIASLISVTSAGRIAK